MDRIDHLMKLDYEDSHCDDLVKVEVDYNHYGLVKVEMGNDDLVKMDNDYEGLMKVKMGVRLMKVEVGYSYHDLVRVEVYYSCE